MTNEHTSLEKYTSYILFSKGLRKGWYWLCVRGELESETDCNTLTPSYSDYSSISSSFCWAAQPGSWGPKPSVWSWLSLQHLVPNCDLNSNCDYNWNWTLPASDFNCNWTKPSVAPGYIIVWHPPASCGCRICTEFNPSTGQGDIFDQMHLFLPHIYTGASLNWRLSRGSICYTRTCSILLAAFLCNCPQAFSPFVQLTSMRCIHIAVLTRPLLGPCLC